MRILDLQPVASHGGGAVKLVATFDLELSDDIKMYALRLMRAGDGRHLTYAPNGNGGRRLATFSPALAAQITKAAVNQLEGQVTADGATSEN